MSVNKTENELFSEWMDKVFPRLLQDTYKNSRAALIAKTLYGVSDPLPGLSLSEPKANVAAQGFFGRRNTQSSNPSRNLSNDLREIDPEVSPKRNPR